MSAADGFPLPPAPGGPQPLRRTVEAAAWVHELRAFRDAGWVVFDWLAAVEEPAAQEPARAAGAGGSDAPGAGGSGRDPGADEVGQVPAYRLTVQLLRPRRPRRDPDSPGASADPGVARGFGRLMVSTRLAPGESAESLTGLWPGAAWHEREAWEMYGLDFAGFTDHTGLGMRPLLLDGQGVESTPFPRQAIRPLRKSVLLHARTETPWPGSVEPGESAEPASERGGRSGRDRATRRRQRPLGVPAAGQER